MVMAGGTPSARSSSVTPPRAPALPGAPSGESMVMSPKERSASWAGVMVARRASSPARPSATSAKVTPPASTPVTASGSRATMR